MSKILKELDKVQESVSSKKLTGKDYFERAVERAHGNVTTKKIKKSYAPKIVIGCLFLIIILLRVFTIKDVMKPKVEEKKEPLYFVGNFDKINKKALELFKANQYVQAIGIWEKWLTFNPKNENTEIFTNLAVSYFELGKIKEAVSLLQIAVKVDPLNPFALNNLAYLYILQKNYEKAVDLLLKATKVGDTYADPFFNLATAYQSLGNWEKAYENFVSYKKLAWKNKILLQKVDQHLAKIYSLMQFQKNMKNKVL